MSVSDPGPEFRKLWLARTVSNLGDGVMLAAAPLLAAALTRDPVSVAGLFFAQRVPWLIFPLISGVFVDRLDRRLVLVATDVFRATLVGTLGLLVLSGWASLPVIYAIFFLLGAAETFSDLASYAMVPAVVPRERLEKANGRLYGAEIISNQFAGPPLGGFLFAVAAAVPFFLDAGTFAAAAALALALRGSFRPEKPAGAPRPNLVAEIGEGLRWLVRHRLLRTLALMLGAMNTLLAATGAIFVLFAQEVLGLGNLGYGLILSSAAVGGVLGSLVAPGVIRLLGPGRTILACVLLEAATQAVIASTSAPLLVGAMFALFGCASMGWNVVTVSLRQAVVPDHLFGRVNSVYRLLGYGGMSVGALMGGFLARGFGLTTPFWFAAIGMTVLVLVCLPVVNNRTVAAVRDGA